MSLLGVSSWGIDSQTPGRPLGGSPPSVRGYLGSLGQGQWLPQLPHPRTHVGRSPVALPTEDQSHVSIWGSWGPPRLAIWYQRDLGSGG